MALFIWANVVGSESFLLTATSAAPNVGEAPTALVSSFICLSSAFSNIPFAVGSSSSILSSNAAWCSLRSALFFASGLKPFNSVVALAGPLPAKNP